MYAVTLKYIEAIQKATRNFTWYGSIKDKNGATYSYTASDIVKGTGSIVRSCAGSTSLELGSVYAAEFDVSLFSDIDRYLLYGGTISLTFRLKYSGGTYEDVPLGIFIILEATRAVHQISIKAFDNMLNFDKKYTVLSGKRTPYEWLQYACGNCGVTLGMSTNEMSTLTNGSATVSINDSDGLIATYRDMISYLAAMTCSVAQITRTGNLVLLPYSMIPIRTIANTWRYGSSFSDYETHYTGMYLLYKDSKKSTDEYYHVNNDDGLIYDIGQNPFLEISDNYTRAADMQNIINTLSTIYYTPFSITTPGDPALDPMDVLAFTGGQAIPGKYACITSITTKINGQQEIKCVGENPLLASAVTRESKLISIIENVNESQDEDISDMEDRLSTMENIHVYIDHTPTAADLTGENGKVFLVMDSEGIL